MRNLGQIDICTLKKGIDMTKVYTKTKTLAIERYFPWIDLTR